MLQFKKLLAFFIATFLFSKTAYSQDNRISLRANYLFSFVEKINTNDTLANINSKAWQILPSIGFYHTFKNNIGVGIELGYRNSNYSGIIVNNNPTNSSVRTITNNIHYQSYYICPAIYETFKFKNYIANLSFIIPVEYIAKLEQMNTDKQVDRQLSIISNESQTNIKWPKTLQYALLLHASVYRKIYNGLYIGAELGIGPMFESRFGNSYRDNRAYVNGNLVISDSYTDKYKSYTIVNLNMRPTISIQYIFTKKQLAP